MQHEPAAQFRAHEVRSGSTLLARTIPSRWLIAGLLAYLSLGQLLLWRFLDMAPAAAFAVAAPLVALVCWSATRPQDERSSPDPRLAAFLIALAASTALFLLGGEGRVFYSNIDWQVRDAVLRDMAVNPWSFAYEAGSELEVLRAPLGMYFVPALAWKAFGPVAGDWAMLVQNSVLLATLLTLASTLFSNMRERLTGLAVFILFSGLDALGALATGRWADHLDAWAGTEFSSTITLAFWVPHHALAGWSGALAFLLWSKGGQSIRFLVALPPLLALWSPFALIGTLPFAGVAVAGAMHRKQLHARDLLAPALTLALAAPSLVYLSAASPSVGAGLSDLTVVQFLFFEAVETLPYLVPIALLAARCREHRAALCVPALCLLVAPWFRIGTSMDFAARATIPALAILALLTADALARRRDGAPRGVRIWLCMALGIGTITGAAEVTRAAVHRPAPRQDCSFIDAWNLSFGRFPKDAYLGRLNDMPPLLRPTSPSAAKPSGPGPCSFDGWYRPLPPDFSKSRD
ncbi:MAG TPA: hypothetical protein VIL42_01305 [Sphingomicrobium sp.]|jgi:dolichol kinase